MRALLQNHLVQNQHSFQDDTNESRAPGSGGMPMIVKFFLFLVPSIKILLHTSILAHEEAEDWVLDIDCLGDDE